MGWTIPLGVVEIIKKAKRGVDVYPSGRVVLRESGGVVSECEWKLRWGVEGGDQGAVSILEFWEFCKKLDGVSVVSVTRDHDKSDTLTLSGTGKGGVPVVQSMYDWTREKKDGVLVWEQTTPPPECETVACEWLGAEVLQANVFTDSEMGRYALGAVLVSTEGVYGSDGRRLYQSGQGAPLDMGLVLVRKLAVPMLGAETRYGVVENEHGMVWQMLGLGDMSLWLRPVEGRFPRVVDIIPERTETCDLSGVAVAVAKTCRSVGKRDGTAVWICRKRLVVLADQHRSGVEFEIPDSHTIATVNPTYLAEFLEAGLTKFCQPTRDRVIRFDGEDGATGALMPLTSTKLGATVRKAKIVKHDPTEERRSRTTGRRKGDSVVSVAAMSAARVEVAAAPVRPVSMLVEMLRLVELAKGCKGDERIMCRIALQQAMEALGG